MRFWKSSGSKLPWSMEQAELIWHNGEFVRWEDAKVHVLSHGLHYGTGVFEGIRCYETERGPAVFRHREHLDRLEKSAELYYFQIPYSAIQREHEAAIAEASAAGAGIVIRGGIARGAPSDWDARINYMVPAETAKSRWEGAKLDELRGGMSPMEFTLRFTLSNPDLDTTIVGTRNLDHLADNVAAAAKGPLPADVMEEAKRSLAEAGSRPE